MWTWLRWRPRARKGPEEDGKVAHLSRALATAASELDVAAATFRNQRATPADSLRARQAASRAYEALEAVGIRVTKRPG